MASVRRESPKSRIVIHNMGADSDYLKLLSDGELDVVIANWDEMTVEDYPSLSHVAPSQMMPGYSGVIESFLARQNPHRNVVVESAYFGLIPYMLTRSDLVLTTGRQFMRFHEKNLPLKIFTVPVKFPAMRFYQLWHERVHHAPEHKWLRELIASTAKSLIGGG